MNEGNTGGLKVRTNASSWVLITAIAFVLTLFGLVMLFSAAQSVFHGAYVMLAKQAVWTVLAFIGFLVAARVPLDMLRRYSWVLYGVSLLGLILILIPGIGVKVNGAQRWLGFGPVRLQVSEFAKIGLVLAMAHFMSSHQREIKTFLKGFLVPCCLIGGVCGLVMLQPDFGTTLLIATVGLIMLYQAGANLYYLVPSATLGAGAFSALVYLDPVRLRRVTAFLDVEANLNDGAYQLWQGILAFGAGGMNGVGLGRGRQQLSFLPEAHTDFIFAVIGEELGLLCTGGVVLLFLVVFLVVSWHARNAPRLFDFLLLQGSLMAITLQALINVGVVTGCLPTKGMSLPFISYGGSNLVVVFCFVGFIVNVLRSWNRPTLPTVREI
ncbi:MAG: putative lipid II flippase FtsW [Opitutae bacterium]|nr:putative lipid II flippase FtsW [Opitutae bacterium]|tara:strand:+ start:11135 stop:12277 length:1143 start_codon:yes stop_codon:yes gene_type:complete